MPHPDEEPSPAEKAVTLEAPSETVHQDRRPTSKQTIMGRLYDCFTYVPHRCRYDPEKPFEFSMGLNVLFGTQGTVLSSQKKTADTLQ